MSAASLVSKVAVSWYTRLPPRDPADALVVLGSQRSGTTWLAEMIARASRRVVVFEPLHLDEVPAARAAGFEWRTHRRPDEAWPDGAAFLTDAMSGRVISPWTISPARPRLRPRWVVKLVRANRLLPWLVHHVPTRPPLLVVRHPCAVVASQLSQDAWSSVARPEIDDRLEAERPGLAAAAAGLTEPEEFLAMTWAIDQVVPLRAPAPHRWTTISYEHLLLDPVEVLGTVNPAVDPDRWDLGRLRPRARSRTSFGSSDDPADLLGNWQRRLSPDQVTRILAIAHSVGLDWFDSSPVPPPPPSP